MSVQRVRRSIGMLIILATLLAAPTAALGFDGEVNNAGDFDSVTRCLRFGRPGNGGYRVYPRLSRRPE